MERSDALQVFLANALVKIPVTNSGAMLDFLEVRCWLVFVVLLLRIVKLEIYRYSIKQAVVHRECGSALYCGSRLFTAKRTDSVRALTTL